MLCLTRKVSESVVIDVPPSTTRRRINVMVVKTGQRKTELGFTADADVSIAREEVCKPLEEWEQQ